MIKEICKICKKEIIEYSGCLVSDRWLSNEGLSDQNIEKIEVENNLHRICKDCERKISGETPKELKEVYEKQTGISMLNGIKELGKLLDELEGDK